MRPESERRDRRQSDRTAHTQERLIARLRRDAALRDAELATLRDRLDAAEHELDDLRAVRDALTPFELPKRPGLDLAAAVPAE